MKCPRPPRRGIAMLLILVVLATSTILVSSYLASRDNSSLIALGVTNGIEARWASESGLDLVLAILETEADWRTAHTNGRLLDDYALDNGATIDVDLLDSLTFSPPNEDSTHVLITVSAQFNGVTTTATGEAMVPVGFKDTIDLDLSEFAVFAGDSLDLEDTTTIGVWPQSPLADNYKKLNIGVAATDASTVSLGINAAVLDTTIFVDDSASPLLLLDASEVPPRLELVSDPIPMPNSPDPGVIQASSGAEDLTVMGATLSIKKAEVGNENRAGNVTVEAGSTLAIAQQGSIAVFEGNFNMSGDSYLTIGGDETVVVLGDVTLDSAAFELGPEATLSLYIGGEVLMTNSYVGEKRGTTNKDGVGDEEYMDPSRIRVFSLEGAPSSWVISGDTVFKGTIYAPDANVVVGNTASVYGSLSAQTVKLTDQAAVFFDPALDNRLGYANLKSQVYNASGDIRPSILALASQSPSDLNAVATSEKLVVESFTKSVDGRAVAAPAPALPSTPTDRPIPVELTVTSIGLDPSHWESPVVENSNLAGRVKALAIDLARTRSDLFQGADGDQQLAEREQLVTDLYDIAMHLAADEQASARADLDAVMADLEALSCLSDCSTSRYVTAQVDRFIAELPRLDGNAVNNSEFDPVNFGFVGELIGK